MVTIAKIAQELGVSTSTVSKALNGYSEISEKTRSKIMNLATEMGYTPNATAQSLVRKRADTVGVVYEVEYGLKNLFFSSVLEAFRRNVQGRGYDILFLSDNGSGQDYLKHCISKNVDAVLVISTGTSVESVRKLINSDLALMMFDPWYQSKNTIYTDSYNAIKKSCKYLYDLGHRKIAFLNGSYSNFIGRERLKGYLDFIKEKNLEPYYIKNHSNESYSYDEGYKTMKNLFETYGLPDAVCTVSDLMAIGALHYLQNHGYAVPDDVSIIGFDDLSICDISTPKLTTMKQDIEAIGKQACDALIDMLVQGHRTVKPIIVDATIVVRDSCKKKSNH